ncbi:MAG: hypothetical protein Q9166_006572 [cf. Caloplaca sp. 2 TL-2023]
MDGVSIPASLVSIGAAGCQIAIKLYTLATQISTASDRISSISNDVSLTSGVLQQLGDLMTPKPDGTTIFSQGGLETTKTSAAMCERIFKEIEQAVRDASEQIRGRARFADGKIKLSKSEKVKWPFLQPSIESLRIELREAKGTLMLMLQVTSLAFSKKMAEVHQRASTNIFEQREIINAILAIKKHQPGSKDPRSTRLSVCSSGRETPKAPIERTLDERTPWPDENSTPAQGQFPKSAASLPIRPNFLTALPPPNMPPAESTSPRSSKSLSTKSECDISTKSSSSESLRGGGMCTPAEPTLDFYLMKPFIKDLVDVIQLSWQVRKIQMQQAGIQKQIEKNEQESNPPVHEVYKDMYTHEHAALENEISKAGSDVSLLSLKRIHVDLTHREILFKGIPGLQFVLEHGSPAKHPEAETQMSKVFKESDKSPHGSTEAKPRQVTRTVLRRKRRMVPQCNVLSEADQGRGISDDSLEGSGGFAGAEGKRRRVGDSLPELEELTPNSGYARWTGTKELTPNSGYARWTGTEELTPNSDYARWTGTMSPKPLQHGPREEPLLESNPINNQSSPARSSPEGQHVRDRTGLHTINEQTDSDTGVLLQDLQLDSTLRGSSTSSVVGDEKGKRLPHHEGYTASADGGAEAWSCRLLPQSLQYGSGGLNNDPGAYHPVISEARLIPQALHVASSAQKVPSDDSSEDDSEAMDVDGIDEQEAERIVEELLGRYTTLFEGSGKEKI